MYQILYLHIHNQEDYRTNIHHTLKKKTLQFEDLQDFINCYNPENRHIRKETWNAETCPEGRWRSSRGSLTTPPSHTTVRALSHTAVLDL